MRNLLFLPLVLLLLGISAAQSTANPEKGQNEASKPVGPKTLAGCLSGNSREGYFLGSDTGDLYQVIGSNASLHRYAGQTVRITGTVAYRKPAWSPSRVLATLPPTLTLSSIKKVSDTCE